MPINEYKRTHARDYLQYLLRERKVNNRTCNNYKDSVRAIFNHIKVAAKGARADYRQSICGYERSFLMKKKTQYVAFSAEEARQLIAYMKQFDKQMLFFIQFIYYCGLRPKEICSLRVGNIDMNRRKILIKGKEAKNRKTAYINIPLKFYEILQERDIFHLSSLLLPVYPERSKYRTRTGI